MELTSIIEALLFSARGAITSKALSEAIRTTATDSEKEEWADLAKVKPEEVIEGIGKLIEIYREQGRAFTLTERPGGWRICALPEYADWSKALFPSAAKPSRLSPPALETLAIIAYRQPITKANMEAVRGVSVDGVLQKLLDKNLVRIAGRADLPGRPLLYETTDLFLEHFGIRSIEDLPNSAELRQVSLPDTGAGETGDGAPVETQLALTAIDVDDPSMVTDRNQRDLRDPDSDGPAGEEAEEPAPEEDAAPGEDTADAAIASDETQGVKE